MLAGGSRHRLRNLKDRKFHAFEKLGAYPALKADLGPRINIDLILHNWDELLRMAASMNERIVAPSTILKKLSASRRPSELARALREVGRLERTRFMIEMVLRSQVAGAAASAVSTREEIGPQVEARRLLSRARRGPRPLLRQPGLSRLRPQSRGQRDLISLEYTVYFARVVDSLKGKGRTIPSHLLKHVSPISWEHINLTGTYSWRTEPTDPTSFRPLREEKSFFGLAA